MNLIYIADPMCSWCYGFAKELTSLTEATPQLKLQIVVGGVRAGETATMSDEMKHFRLGHWARVESLSGLTFNREAFVALENFVYDTEPVCRAVVTARKLAPDMAILPLFRHLQETFYVHGRDTTSDEVLAEVGAQVMTSLGYPTHKDTFLMMGKDEATMAETQQDFLKARSWGISSFPALLLEVNGQLHIVATGYMAASELEKNLRLILEQVDYRPLKAV
ncbi:DsbA family protein [Pseudomonas sp. R-28-1W-6]|uniref:DsbA family protein n=1 Tax=Pseudomonas sp. R-28-1W-6 TaxID=2650101 RepID=UPI001365E5BA|nr:DsbA family protein [Pseudomonas sp. R-28-1W-6]MWV14312.1 DsbA family protein [Pseudomonas sp. R-28-1W-6]